MLSVSPVAAHPQSWVSNDWPICNAQMSRRSVKTACPYLGCLRICYPRAVGFPPITLASYTLLIGVQVCEVSVDVTNSADGRSYTVQCELVQESGRVYRLDGKLKTGKEIKVSAAILNRVCVMNTQPARICTILSW